MLSKSLGIDFGILGDMLKQVMASPYQLFQVDLARVVFAKHRLNQARQQNLISKLNDPEDAIANTVKHNFESLQPELAFQRPWALLGPLLGIDRIGFNLSETKVLIVGPRTEAEIFLYISRGFNPENVLGLDLISYSDFIVSGDMHDMPFEDNSFDVVVFSWVLGYSTNQKKAVSEAIRVLKNHGFLCIGEQWDPTPISVVSEQMQQSRGYSLEGTVTSSPQDLVNLLSCESSTIFSTEPMASDKGRVGWITSISQISK